MLSTIDDKVEIKSVAWMKTLQQISGFVADCRGEVMITSNRSEPSFKDKRSVLFCELVCFQIVVFPRMKAASHTSGSRSDKLEDTGLQNRAGQLLKLTGRRLLG